MNYCYSTVCLSGAFTGAFCASMSGTAAAGGATAVKSSWGEGR